jgi:hypothetical protein
MYATAHRVKSRDGQVGINALLHEHRGDEGGLISWDNPDVVAVAEGYVGMLVAQSFDVPPGGNRVLSYLDVAAADGVAPVRVAKALDAFGNLIGKEPSPITAVLNGVGVRLGWSLGLTPGAHQEFDALCQRVLEILRAERPSTEPRLPPLEIRVAFDESGYAFALAPESVSRVREAHRTDEWNPARLQVKPEVMMDFQAAHGDIIPHVVAGLTQLRLENVIALGGVVFVGHDGKEVRRWPRAAR